MTDETHSHPVKVSHPTAKCSIAAELYFRWAAACKEALIIWSNPPTMTDEGRKNANAVGELYRQHVSGCRICRGEV